MKRSFHVHVIAHISFNLVTFLIEQTWVILGLNISLKQGDVSNVK